MKFRWPWSKKPEEPKRGFEAQDPEEPKREFEAQDPEEEEVVAQDAEWNIPQPRP